MPMFTVKFLYKKCSSTEIMARRQRPMAKKLSLQSLDASLNAYYDSLTDAEVEEDRLWGEFAGHQLGATHSTVDLDQ
jgi:hypothetical protein